LAVVSFAQCPKWTYNNNNNNSISLKGKSRNGFFDLEQKFGCDRDGDTKGIRDMVQQIDRKRLEEVFVTRFQLFFFPPSEHSSVSFLPITLHKSWHSSWPHKTPAAIRGQQVEKRIKCLPVHQLFSASTKGKKKKDDENKTLKYFLSCLMALYTTI
jgi:hypothetical protein